MIMYVTLSNKKFINIYIYIFFFLGFVLLAFAAGFRFCVSPRL